MFPTYMYAMLKECVPQKVNAKDEELTMDCAGACQLHGH